MLNSDRVCGLILEGISNLVILHIFAHKWDQIENIFDSSVLMSVLIFISEFYLFIGQKHIGILDSKSSKQHNLTNT